VKTIFNGYYMTVNIFTINSMTKKDRYNAIIAYFREHRPEADTELIYADPYELIVSVILSAQCTDKRVNMITPALFRAYPTVFDLAKANERDIFQFIKSCSYPNNKAKHLSGMAKMLVADFDGQVPSDVNVLQKLPGVGRKTANVIASVIYHLPHIAVDTHVFRVANRIGLTTNAKTPLQTELQLMKYIKEELRPLAHHWLILHGRYVCKARKPLCQECGVKNFCRYFQAEFR
jgi:endonuclease-3